MKRRILVSGAGSIGMRHLRNLRVLGINDLAVSDPDADHLKNAADELQVEPFADFTEALTRYKPSIVLACGPTITHVPQALEAAKTGAHVFIEKPLSHTPERIDELQEETAKRNRACMVGCNMRFHPGPAMVKKLLDEGRIGKILEAEVYTGSYLPNWRPQQDYKKSYSADPAQGGAVLDCIHEIDLALWYFGPAKIAQATTQSAATIGLPEIDGTADINLVHEGGMKSHVHLSFTEPEYRRFCAITGTKGSIRWDFTEKIVEVKNRDGKIVDSFAEPENWEPNDMYIDEMKHFLECIETQQAPRRNLAEANAALQIALQARNTAKMSDK
ncbi:MAG: Gfo/Idh/MocA family oxidoreductase [Candidatus Peribacteraceae bacterium]|nr:Gfo/Idh/MocA family oxidoreductase [Candidatus Peribacteraceae bacterium]